jgi:hypothetical protein
MSHSLEEAKNRLRQAYLGRGGIHAVGVSRAEQALRVYVSPQAVPGQPEVLAELREAAKPFPIIVVREERAQMT